MSALTIIQKDATGMLGLEEFKSLWNDLVLWKVNADICHIVALVIFEKLKIDILDLLENNYI